MKRYLLFIPIVCICMLASCKDEYSICNLPKDVRFIASFFQVNNGIEVIAPAPNLNINQLITGAPLYTQQANVPTFSTALNPLLDSVKYYIKLSNSLPADTLTIVYTSTGANLSPECGAITYYNITKLYSTLNTIDSVKIKNPLLNTDLLQNAKIYY